MGIDRDLDTEGDRPGGWGSPGGPAGASCGAGVGSSIGGEGSGRPLPGSGLKTLSLQRGWGPGRGGSAPPPLPRQQLRAGMRCRSASPPPSALPQSPLLWQPQSRHLPFFPLPGSASSLAGDNERGAFPAWWGEDSVIILLFGFAPACDPSSLQEFRDPFGEVVPYSPREDARV